MIDQSYYRATARAVRRLFLAYDRQKKFEVRMAAGRVSIWGMKRYLDARYGA